MLYGKALLGGTQGETRTRTTFQSLVPETSVSTISPPGHNPDSGCKFKENFSEIQAVKKCFSAHSFKDDSNEKNAMDCKNLEDWRKICNGLQKIGDAEIYLQWIANF